MQLSETVEQRCWQRIQFFREEGDELTAQKYSALVKQTKGLWERISKTVALLRRSRELGNARQVEILERIFSRTVRQESGVAGELQVLISNVKFAKVRLRLLLEKKKFGICSNCRQLQPEAKLRLYCTPEHRDVLQTACNKCKVRLETKHEVYYKQAGRMHYVETNAPVQPLPVLNKWEECLEHPLNVQLYLAHIKTEV